jgi:hypothetical protein
MKTIFLSPVFLFLILCLPAQIRYTTSCELRDGKAYGFVNNYLEALEVDGTHWFYFYDCEGRYLGGEDEYEYEYVSRGAREEIEVTRAPANSCYCEFNLDEAASKNQQQGQPGNGPGYPPQSQRAFTTDCEIKAGTAFGL